jgi:deoxyribose-phosphate aldolase
MAQGLNRVLDAAILKPETTQAEVRAAIAAMIEAGTITVCVRPCDIALALQMCRGTQTAVGCVLGFPHGDALSESKADEAARYVALGVAEIDMVSNYGLVRSGEWERVERDFALVREAAGRVTLKAILESGALTTDEIAQATRLAVRVGLDFVKTSTGFGAGAATEEAVRAMIAAGGGRIRVKASGGIRTREAAERYLALGCARLGVNYGTAAELCGVKVGDWGQVAGGPAGQGGARPAY